jgi:FlaA1/EpsC-like NDP-sugar epimerase
LLLLLAEAALVYGALIGAVYLRVGVDGAPFELISKNGYWKAAVCMIFCLGAFYLFDLYDFVVMHDRRELVLRLIQALGLAWIALALAFYLFPALMLGRSIALLALPLALGLMVAWRVSIHWFFGDRWLGQPCG